MNYFRSALVVLVTTISPEEKAFNDYIIKFGKNYATKEEYNFRLKIFTENLNYNK
jgi:hypothetical protein